MKYLALTFVLFCSAPALANNDQSVIMIMVDGTRTDVVEQMAANGELPNIKKYFLDGGAEFRNSFTPISLTVPSWSTILTGIDNDKTGIKGNDTFNRKTMEVENYLDWRKDILSAANRLHGRAYRTIHGVGNKLVMDYFDRGDQVDNEGFVLDDYSGDSDVFMSFYPVNDTFPSALITGLTDNLLDLDEWRQFNLNNALMRLLYDFSGYADVDRNSVERGLNVLYDPKSKKKKLIGIYFASVDHLQHIEHVRGRRALQQVDSEIGRIFEAMRMTRYSDSVVVLVSDHGSLGGEEYSIDNTYNPLRGETYALTNTNLSQLLGGWYNKAGYADYNFDVEAAFASEGKFSLRNAEELQLQAYQCTNPSAVEFAEYGTCQNFASTNPSKITAGVTSTETITLPYASRTSGDWLTPNNWYTLTHYSLGLDKAGKPLVKNVIQDLENFTLENLLTFDSALARKIGNQPLDWLAVSLSKNDFNHSADAIKFGLTSDQDVVILHKSAQNEALILRSQGLFRYQPISSFEQASDKSVSFNLSVGLDPLEYNGNPLARRDQSTAFESDSDWFTQFHSDRDWANRYAETAFPNTVSALTRLMSFRDGASALSSSLRADIFLNPRYGHYFTVNNDTDEVNHGMWQRESVRNMFMIAGPGIKKGAKIETPAFSIDVMATALEAVRRNGSQAPEVSTRIDGKALPEAFE